MTAPSPATCQENFEQAVGLALHLWPALSLAVQSGWGGPDSDDKRAWFAGAVAELFPDISRLWRRGQGQEDDRQQPSRYHQHQQQRTLQTVSSSTSSFSSSPSNQQQVTRRQQQQQPPGASSSSPALPEEPELFDVESVLLQVMLDEFDVNVDDESALEVAGNIMRVRAACLRGSFAEVEAMRRRWEASRGKRVAGVQTRADPGRGDGDEWGSSDDDDDDGDDNNDERSSADDNDEEDVEMMDAPAPGREESKQPPEVDEDGFTKVTRRKR